MSNKQIALTLAVAIRYFSKLSDKDLFKLAESLLYWLDTDNFIR